MQKKRKKKAPKLTTNDTPEMIKTCMKCTLPGCVNCLAAPDKIVVYHGKEYQMQELCRSLGMYPTAVRMMLKNGS